MKKVIAMFLAFLLFFTNVRVVAAQEGEEFDVWDWVEKNAKRVFIFLVNGVLDTKWVVEYIWNRFIYEPLRNTVLSIVNTVTGWITQGISKFTEGITAFVDEMSKVFNAMSEGLVKMMEGFLSFLRKMFGLEVIACLGEM